MNIVKQFFNDESAATMVEYGIMIALLAIAVATTVVLLSTEIKNTFKHIVDCLKDSASCP